MNKADRIEAQEAEYKLREDDAVLMLKLLAIKDLKKWVVNPITVLRENRRSTRRANRLTYGSIPYKETSGKNGIYYRPDDIKRVYKNAKTAGNVAHLRF